MEVLGKSTDFGGTINCIPNLQNGQYSIKLRYFEKMEHYSTGRVYQKVRSLKRVKKEGLQKLNQNDPGQHIDDTAARKQRTNEIAEWYMYMYMNFRS